MKHTRQLVLSFSATFLGFIFALALFVIQEDLKESRENKILLRNVIYELQYNLLVLDGFDQKFEKTIRKIMNDEKNVILGLSYLDIQFFFLNKIYKKGDLIHYLTMDDLTEAHRVTAIYSQAWGDIIYEYLEKWNADEETKKNILIVMEYEKTTTMKSKKLFKKLIIKLSNSL